MKTHIVQLEIHDDVYSTKDKMMWGKSGQILLVIPADNGHLQRKLDLVLLQRHAKAIGSKLGIVTQDAKVMSIARNLEIPVFANTTQAQAKVWRKGKKARTRNEHERPKILFDEIRVQVEKVNLPRLENTWLRIIIFGMAVFSLIALLIFLLPHATIKISMEEKIQIKDLAISAQSELTTVSISGEIPARKISVLVSKSGSVIATGMMTVPAEQASGSIEVTNISAEDLTIPEGTLIRSSAHPGISFVTTKFARIETGKTKKMIVPVIALEAGTIGNVDAGQLDQIEGDFNFRVLISNPEPTSGGKDSIVAAPAQEDYLKLREILTSKLKTAALVDIEKEQFSGEIILDGSFVKEEIVSEEWQPEENSPSDKLILTIQARYSIYAIKEADLYRSAQMSLDASIPEGWTKKKNSLFIQEISSSEIISHNPVRIGVKIQAAQLLLPKIDQAGLVQSLLGKPKRMASELISKHLAVTSVPEIKVTPMIWNWLPFLPVNIELSYQ